MKPADVLRLLWRRWYITIPGVLLAVAAVMGAWAVVGPQYQRAGTQMLLPGEANLPEGATNPFLFIGGLQLPADVLVQTVGDPTELAAILEDHPDTDVLVERAPGAAPVIRTVVTSSSDTEAAAVLTLVMENAVTILDELQTSENVAPASRIQIVTLTVDADSTLLQRARIVAAGGVGVGVLVLVFVLAALVDGLARRRRRAAKADGVRRESPADTEPDQPDGADARGAGGR